MWVKSALRKQPYTADFSLVEPAYEQYTKRISPDEGRTLSSYLPNEWSQEKLDLWQKIMLAIGDEKGTFDRHRLAELFLDGFPNRDRLIEDLIEKGGWSDFSKVDLPHAGSDIYSEAYNVEVKQPRTREPLKRQLSQMLTRDKQKGDNEQKEVPPPRPGERRSFFRTWVRAERRGRS
jgi:hypothetical protein